MDIVDLQISNIKKKVEGKTLKDALDYLGYTSSFSYSFMIIDGNVTLLVTRTYLESKPMQSYLDKCVKDVTKESIDDFASPTGYSDILCFSLK